MTLRDVAKLFPILVSIFDTTKFADTLAKILSWAAQDPRILAVPRRGHSRGFWNTVAMALKDLGDLLAKDVTCTAYVVLKTKTLSGEDRVRIGCMIVDCFDQVIAELFCIGALGSAFAALDLESWRSKRRENWSSTTHTQKAGGLQDCLIPCISNFLR